MRITQNLRNIFDQYEQEENKLTHALLHTVSSDKAFFANFLDFTLGKNPFDRNSHVFIRSQGKYEPVLKLNSLSALEKDSIPDGLIYDSKGEACIIIESKVTAPISLRQLRFHIKNARYYSAERTILLLLTSDKQVPSKVMNSLSKSSAEVHWMPWWKIYQWIETQPKNSITTSYRDFLEILESNIITRNSSWDGMMTKFNGIPFGEGEPYSYTKAKWCLNAFMHEIRNSARLKKIYTLDDSKGRKAITGSSWSFVWDYIPFANSDGNFTKHPHLTFVIKPEWTQIQITLPNAAKASYWNNLFAKENSFKSLLLEVHSKLYKGKPKSPTKIKLWVELLQRHYRYQKDKGIRDGEMYFDVDCLTDKKKFDPQVKSNSAWIEAIEAVLKNRSNTNTQLAIVARYEHVKGSVVNKTDFVDEAVRALESLKPFYNLISKG